MYILPSLSILACTFNLVLSAPSVTIPAGKILGTTCANGASAFLSIPFGVPPVGSLRWTAPQPYNLSFPVAGYDASKKGAVCIQFGGEFTETGLTSEDCLYLNVWAPPNTTSTSNLPVKVWIYGGGQQGGGIQNPLYDGCNLAAHDTLLVSINYRLGPLGYLALPGTGINGNYGIQDLILGLEWVQSHISAFGGNPMKVVVFGESAGATNTFIISSLSQAPSLMNAAIWESGAGPQLATPAVASNFSAAYAKTLNCSSTNITCLRSVPATTLQATAPEGSDVIIYSALNPSDFQPYVDGVTIPVQPWSAGPKVPMIFGSNTDEGGLFAVGTYQTVEVSLDNYTIFLNENFGTAAPLVAKQYPPTLPAFVATGFPVFAAIATIITDAQFQCPAYQAMLKAQANNIPVYTYLNAHVPSCQWSPGIPATVIPYVKATHTSEIPFVFGNGANQPLPNGTCNFTSQEHTISENLIAAWSAMAENGSPSVQGGLQWPRWNSSASLGVGIANATAVGAVDYSQCVFWDMIDNLYLNFTSTSYAATSPAAGNGSGNGSTATSGGSPTGTATKSATGSSATASGNNSNSTGNAIWSVMAGGAGRGVGVCVWGLTLVTGFAAWNILD